MNRLQSVLSAAGLLLLASGAFAQSFNLDVGDSSGAPTFSAGVPANTYGAAAGQPGFWNASDFANSWAHASVRVFTFAPPASAERLLEVERRIATKLGASARTLGVAGAILPSLADALPDDDSSAIRAAERLRARVASWRRENGSNPDACVASAARSRAGHRASLAVIADQTGTALVASVRGVITDDPRKVLEVALLVDQATSAPPDERAIARERTRFLRWMEARAAERAAGGISIESAARRIALRRLSGILSRTPIGKRRETAALVTRARTAAARTMGIGGEFVLGQLAMAPMSDEAWLKAMAAFADAHRASDHAGIPPSEPRVLAIVLVG